MKALPILGLTVFTLFALASPASAQLGMKPVAQDDPAKSAFLAMPEADRKAVQDALGWLGLYNGTVDGSFGKRTADAIVAYQKKRQAIADGIVDSRQFTALTVAATAARAAVGFEVFDDSGSGVRIGAPLKLLTKRDVAKGRTKLSSRDGALTLDLVDADGALEALYKAEIIESDTRKVTYKAYKAESFFVVAGDSGDAKFYERYAVGEAGKLRGFAFTFPKARAADLDRVTLAVANSFEPFPAAAAAKPEVIAKPEAKPTPPVDSAPKPPALTASAFLFAPGLALTALTPADCAKPSIRGAAANFGQSDNGLATLTGSFGAGLAPAALGGATTQALALTLAPGAADAAKLQAGWAALSDLGEGRVSLVVSADEGGRGAPAFDARGGLVAILAASPPSPRINGAPIAEPHAAFGVAALRTLVGSEAPAASGAALSAAEIVRANRARVVAVRCDS